MATGINAAGAITGVYTANGRGHMRPDAVGQHEAGYEGSHFLHRNASPPQLPVTQPLSLMAVTTTFSQDPNSILLIVPSGAM